MCFLQAQDVFLSALRQLALPDGLEAWQGWPRRPYGSISLSRPSHKPFSFSVGNLWAAGCAKVRKGDGPQAVTQLSWWSGVGAVLIQER